MNRIKKTSDLPSKLRLGELFLYGDVWKLSFACLECGLEVDQLEQFLLHAQNHCKLQFTGDFGRLLQQTRNTGVTEPEIDVVLEETTFAVTHDDPLEHRVAVENPLNSEEEQSDCGSDQFEDGSAGAELESAPVSPAPASPDNETGADTLLPEGNDTIRCSWCSKLFKHKSAIQLQRLYNTHMNRHKGIKPYACDQCDKTFSTTQQLRIHQRKYHPGSEASKVASPPNERRHICSQCGKSFKRLQHLRAHEAIHSEERPFPCKLCAKAFKTPHHLRDHMNLHTGKKYTCKQCGKQFAQPAGLYTHKKIHQKAASNSIESQPSSKRNTEKGHWVWY